MSFWKSKTKVLSLPSDPAPPRIDLKPLAPISGECKQGKAKSVLVLDGMGTLPGTLRPLNDILVKPKADRATLAEMDAQELAAALRPKAPKADPIKTLEALREMKRDAGQITFYIYDRGQCFGKGQEAVLAMVNMNGCAAHYMINSQDNTWEFFQMPHLNTEKRACFRMGYASINAMHEHLFSLFDQHLEKIGWNERHQSVVVAV